MFSSLNMRLVLLYCTAPKTHVRSFLFQEDAPYVIFSAQSFQ
jgi:hypothetical protein